MTVSELLAYSGLSEHALLRLIGGFPRKDARTGKTDRKAVDRYFDLGSGLPARFAKGGMAHVDGTDSFDRNAPPRSKARDAARQCSQENNHHRET